MPGNRDVAQLGSASGLGPEGRRFESCHPDQKFLFHKIWEYSSAGIASALQAGCHRFEPCYSHHYAGVAQLVEQLICNQQVAGSSPITSSKNRASSSCLPLYMGEFPSGQRGQTVNLLLSASMVRIHPLPPEILVQ